MTPERALQKMMRNEYGERAFPKQVRFVEPGVGFMSSHPAADFVVGYPGISVTELSSLMGTLYVAARPASTPRTSVGYVPSDLAARGIVAVKASPKSSSSEPTHLKQIAFFVTPLCSHFNKTLTWESLTILLPVIITSFSE